jgi:predicted GTPase
MPKDRVVIMGAAGRDFHNFNLYFRDNPNYEVVAFTASQIPNEELSLDEALKKMGSFRENKEQNWKGYFKK